MRITRSARRAWGVRQMTRLSTTTVLRRRSGDAPAMHGKGLARLTTRIAASVTRSSRKRVARPVRNARAKPGADLNCRLKCRAERRRMPVDYARAHSLI